MLEEGLTRSKEMLQEFEEVKRKTASERLFSSVKKKSTEREINLKTLQEALKTIQTHA